MISARAKITRFDGNERSCPITPKAIVEFERHFKTSMAAAFVGDPYMEHTFWLGWKSEHLAGNVVKPFDQWLDDVSSVVLENEGDVPLDATA